MTILLFLIITNGRAYKLDNAPELAKTHREKAYKIIRVKSTVYTTSIDETDSEPLITASGYKIDTNKLNSGKLRIIAVSQDLLKMNGGFINWGDTLRIYSPEWRFSGNFIVQDCKNKRYKNSIDFLKPLKHFKTQGAHKVAKYTVPANVTIIVKI